jgi:hypothetical protein
MKREEECMYVCAPPPLSPLLLLLLSFLLFLNCKNESNRLGFGLALRRWRRRKKSPDQVDQLGERPLCSTIMLLFLSLSLSRLIVFL